MTILLENRIGMGSEREVYAHPRDPHAVIKIKKKGAKIDRNKIESRYAKFMKDLHFKNIPRIHGWVDTDKGRGLVYDFIKDPDGTPSKSIRVYLENGLDLNVDDTESLINDFFEHAYESNLCIYDANMANFLVQIMPDGTRRIVLIDGFGPRRLTPNWWLRLVSPYFGRPRLMKTRRQCVDEWRMRLRRAFVGAS